MSKKFFNFHTLWEKEFKTAFSLNDMVMLFKKYPKHENEITNLLIASDTLFANIVFDEFSCEYLIGNAALSEYDLLTPNDSLNDPFEPLKLSNDNVTKIYNKLNNIRNTKQCNIF